MGICCSPDFAQEVMESIFNDLDFAECFLDDIGIFDNDFDEHVKHIHQVLHLLQENGFTVNPLKCEWAVQETDWLGYWLTPTGLKPWNKKTNAIKNLQPPKTIKQLRSFIGAVNYYRDMWPMRSHILAPLTALTGANKFVWTDEHQKAFEAMKEVITSDIELAYPNHNLPFHIYTDASDLQLGAHVMQNGKPVAYYSRKLNSAQRNYTTIEKELLSIVSVFAEFRSMLLGAEIHVHTDHRNLTFSNLNTQRVIRWRLYCEEFAPKFHYIPGAKNVLADFLSRQPFTEGKEVPGLDSPNTKSADPVDAFFSQCSASAWNPDVSFADCFFNFPNPLPVVNPVSYAQLQQAQQQQPGLAQLPQQDAARYTFQPFGLSQLVCYRKGLQHNWRIVVPNALLSGLVSWYHHVLSHTGIENLKRSLNLVFYHPLLNQAVEAHVKNCSVCQFHKLQNQGYGELPPRQALAQPWYEVAVDTIGPWPVTIDGVEHKLYAVTIIDTVTNLTELVQVATPNSTLAARAMETGWLHRYPRPVRVIHDQGPEYQGQIFAALLQRYAIDDIPISVRNPQANAICERMHQVVGNILRTLFHVNPPQNMGDARATTDYALSLASHALRSAVHRTLGLSPGAIVFRRDMLMDVPYVANFLLLRDKRQALIDYNLRRENNRRRTFDYAPGQQVLELLPHPTKLGLRVKGPFRIEQVHANGTLTIRRGPHLVDRLNIRRVRPFFIRND